MATRSKSKAAAAALAALLLAALTAGVGAAFTAYYSETRESGYSFYGQSDFQQDANLCLLARYWQAVCAWEGAREPSALLLDDTNADYYARVRSSEEPVLDEAGGDVSFSAEPAESAPIGEHGGLAVYGDGAAGAIDRFNENFRRMADECAQNLRNIYWTVIDNETGEVYAPRVDLSVFTNLTDSDAASRAATPWAYICITRFDAGGALIYRDAINVDRGVRSIDSSGPSQDCVAPLSPHAFDFYDYAPPRDVTVIWAVPRDLTAWDNVSGYAEMERRGLAQSRFEALYWGALCLACALALWFGRKKGSGIGKERLARLPVEAGAGALPAAAFFGAGLLFDVFGDVAESYPSPAVSPTALAAYLLAGAALFAALWLGFLAALSLRQALAVYGWRQAFTRRSLLARFGVWAWGALRKGARLFCQRLAALWQALTRVDPRDPADKTLLRLLAVNFAVLTLLCCTWFFGIVGLLFYSCALFFLLRGRFAALQRDYNALLAAARRMAAGDLAAPAAQEMGVFDPVRDELNEVRAGFERAVEEEVRSRNMKTELITNVSHDLKTPLTAIITYIGLLKDPALAPDVRAGYIDTLDRKSQRLGRLIEDLFEISKAASGNAVMHYDEVDLVSLLRQVGCELADAVEKSGVEFRWQLPEERVALTLDGQKTYRVFENLIVNITKYALPGTRAYISLTKTDAGAVVECKNVSAAELDFDPAAITERFVRGDKSRSTEGSGLGLAIAKSFVELQGGRFSIATDGDLFKAKVVFECGG